MQLRSVLLIAFHYPPCATSSGVQRTLSFSRYLKRYGWNPVVLTATPAAYERTNDQQLAAIPSDLLVARTYALDAARDLAFRGRYWARLTVPDRWLGWWFTAVPKGLSLIRDHAVKAIWSTYPIATAHLVGATLTRLSGLPWIADFRDPMVEYIAETGEVFPKDPALRRARLRTEGKAARFAARLVFCTDAAREIVLERYPKVDRDRLRVISNGYEEQAFRDAEAAACPLEASARRVLLHSGTVYPGADRDPTALMKALRALADRQRIDSRNFELRLRNPSHEDYFRRLAAELNVADLVTILPPLAYQEALSEMLEADGLLLLQGSTSNPAIPAKLYEYLRARRPILALVHPAGESAATLRSLAIDTIAGLTDAVGIEHLLSGWLEAPARLQAKLPSPQVVAEYSRERLTGRLAALLDEITSPA